jgi:Icc-related predicted phosphoesterase
VESPGRESSWRRTRPVRIVLITDIHANLLALEGCLTATESLGVDAVLCGGDLCVPGVKQDYLKPERRKVSFTVDR